jgi:hypothetical protein
MFTRSVARRNAFSPICHWSGDPSYLPLTPPSQVESSASY